MFSTHARGQPAERRGSAIVTVTVLMAVLLLLMAGFLRLLGAAHAEQHQRSDDTQIRYVAEAGLGESYLALERGGDPNRGTPEDPLEFGNVRYWGEAENLGQRVYALRSSSEDRGTRERLELVGREIPDGF